MAISQCSEFITFPHEKNLFILGETKRTEFLLIFDQNSLHLNEDMPRCVSLIRGKLLGAPFPGFMLHFSLASNILRLILISVRPVIKMIT